MARQVNGHLGTFASIEALTAKFPPSESIGCSANVGTAIPYTKAWCDGSEWALVKAPQIQALVSGARILRESSRRGFPLLADITASSGHTLTWQSGTVGGVEYIERDGMRGIRLTTAAGLYVELNVPAFSRLIPKGQVSALYYVPDTPGNAVLATVSVYVGTSGYSDAYNKPVTHSGSNTHANAHTGYFTHAPDPLTSPADTVRLEWQINANGSGVSATGMATASGAVAAVLDKTDCISAKRISFSAFN